MSTFFNIKIPARQINFQDRRKKQGHLTLSYVQCSSLLFLLYFWGFWMELLDTLSSLYSEPVWFDVVVRMPLGDLKKVYGVGSNMSGSFAFSCLSCSEKLWKYIQMAASYKRLCGVTNNLKWRHLFRIGSKVEEEFVIFLYGDIREKKYLEKQWACL